MKNIFMNKYLFVALAIFASLACLTRAKDIAVNLNSAASNTNGSPVAEPTPPTDAARAKTAPDAVVADLYKQQGDDKNPFFQNKNRALVDKYFSKDTADTIWKDAVETKDGEMGALGADPLYDAQDTDIKKFAVGKPAIKDKTAIVPVTFTNFGKKYKFDYQLVEENGAWKIVDIDYHSGYTLLSIYKSNAEALTDTASSGEFEGKYQVGNTTCTVKPIKMAFEVKWEKGSGTEIFFSQGEANDKYIFASDPPKGKANVFSFDDENYNTGTFYRADGKQFAIKRVK